MPTLKMTALGVERLTVPKGQRVDYFDAHPRDRVRGLVLRVSGPTETRADGAKVWAVVYRVKGSKKLRRLTIGDFPTYTLAAAREEADEIVRQARRGSDPVEQRQKEALAKEIADKDTVAAAVERFMVYLAKQPKKTGGMRAPRYVDETRRNFDNHVLPRWRGRSLRQISRRDVNDLLDAIANDGTTARDAEGNKRHVPGGHIAANRTLAAVRALFNWAIRQGIIDSSPVAMVEPRGQETRREHVLSADEIRILWPRAKARGYPFGFFVAMALATGQRRDEVAGMRWADVDEKAKTWTIPKELTKARREHVVPLSPLALDVLDETKKAAMALAKVRAKASCSVPGFDGAPFSPAWRDALWARFFTAAPRRQRRSVERYSVVKRA